MNVLYYGMEGHIGNPTLAWGLIIGSFVFFIVFIVVMTMTSASENWFVLVIIPIAALIIGLNNLFDTRTPIVKAIIDSDIPFKEIQKDYKFKNKEGEIYTFEVLNVDLDQWEQQIAQ